MNANESNGVLAVMKADYVDASVTRMHDPDAEQLAKRSEAAYAAVAELIEASADLAKAVQEETDYLAATPGRVLSDKEMTGFENRVMACTERLHAALARVQGESP